MADAFSKWLDTFVEEKGYDRDGIEFTVETEKNVHIITLGAVVEQMKVATDGERNAIQALLVKIDLADGDALHFFNYMAKPIAEAYDRLQERLCETLMDTVDKVVSQTEEMREGDTK